jgi:hypothetical protein
MEYETLSQLKFMPYSPIVGHITGDAQEKAIRLWDRLSLGGASDRDRFDSEQAIKDAIHESHAGIVADALRPDPKRHLAALGKVTFGALT